MKAATPITALAQALLALLLVVCTSPLVSAAVPQKELDQLVEQLRAAELNERIVAAQTLGGMGPKAAKAVPALMEVLTDPSPILVDSSIDALVAIGSKSKGPLIAVLESGQYNDLPFPRAPVARALLRMDKKARKAVDQYIKDAEPGPELFALFEQLDEDGARFLVAATSNPDQRVEVLRSMRRLAAQEKRKLDVIAPALEKLEDAELSLALSLAWTQSPTRKDVDVLRGWIRGERPELVETALWATGLIGSDAQAAAPAVQLHLRHPDKVVRATALWALGSLASPGPGAPLPEVPASFAGGAESGDAALTGIVNDDVFRLWRDEAKSLGYRGRVSDAARKLWALAPTWTNQVQPVPVGAQRASLPAALLEAEPALIEFMRSDDPTDQRLASDVLSEFGCTSEAVRDIWIGWLASGDSGLRRAALVGLRAFGRGVIEHEPTIIALLGDRETLVPAAQLLTIIATPNGWKAVAEAAGALEGKTPFGLLMAMAPYDQVALRPFLQKMREQYRKGHYAMAALLIRFGAETVPDFQFELGANLADRRMVAAESLGHIGPAAKDALPTLMKVSERHPVAQQLVKDAIKRIQ